MEGQQGQQLQSSADVVMHVVGPLQEPVPAATATPARQPDDAEQQQSAVEEAELQRDIGNGSSSNSSNSDDTADSDRTPYNDNPNDATTTFPPSTRQLSPVKGDLEPHHTSQSATAAGNLDANKGKSISQEQFSSPERAQSIWRA
jgi:hypothetical protein